MTLNKNSNSHTEESVDKDHCNEGKIDITELVAKEDKHLVQPAGVGAAVVGFIFGGPILSALLGFSAAYAVRKKNGAGDFARSLGKLTKSVEGKTSEIEKKNHFIEKTTKSINNFCDDEEEKSVAFKTRAFLVSSWIAASNYTKENQLLERGVEETGKGLEFIGTNIAKLQGKPTHRQEDYVVFPTDESQSTEAFQEMVKVTVH